MIGARHAPPIRRDTERPALRDRSTDSRACSERKWEAHSPRGDLRQVKVAEIVGLIDREFLRPARPKDIRPTRRRAADRFVFPGS